MTIMDQNLIDRICVSIAGVDIDQAIAAAQAAADQAQVIEIRLDTLKNPEVAPFFEAIKTPLLFTNRPTWEGGECKDDEDRRIRPLLAAIEQQAAYDDLELRSPRTSRDLLLKAAAKSKSKIIVSWHNFDKTPEPAELAVILDQQRKSGCHIGKMVGMAHNQSDALKMLALLNNDPEFPLISFAMGRPGTISRLATTRLGGFMTYAAPDQGNATAPGQIRAGKLIKMLKDLDHGH